MTLLVRLYKDAGTTRPRQFSPKVEPTLVRICMDKEGAFRFEAWSMDFNKKGVFLNSPCFHTKRGIKSEQKSMERGYFVDQQTSVCSTFELDCRGRVGHLLPSAHQSNFERF